jgi:hypothetical protein
MKPPIYVRTLTDDERTQLKAERRTANVFRSGQTSKTTEPPNTTLLCLLDHTHAALP